METAMLTLRIRHHDLLVRRSKQRQKQKRKPISTEEGMSRRSRDSDATTTTTPHHLAAPALMSESDHPTQPRSSI